MVNPKIKNVVLKPISKKDLEKIFEKYK